jgi:Secretion system C-terminal sorting domain
MKTITTFFLFLALVSGNSGFAQTTYAVTRNDNYPANCTNCVFNISAGVTLTINQEGSCNNCTFNGGTIAVKKNIICQPCSFNNNTIVISSNETITANSRTTSFTDVVLDASGNSAIIANTPVTATNSVFTLKGNAYFNNNGGQLDISNSTLNLFGNSYFNANAGPVNLNKGSKLVAGDGSTGSKAYIKMNGPVLNIVDKASSIMMANTNNYYFNWSAFNSLSNNATYTTTYPSAASTLNCGAPGLNACGMWSAPTVYGPSLFNYAGVAKISSLLPVVLGNFTAASNGGQAVLDWTTQQETNAAYFIVERSNNGTAWTKAGTIAAKGNTSIATRYTFTDANNLTGTVYYRLAMIDLDGQKAYSEVKSVRSAIVKEISLYPNPATDFVNVSLNGNSNGSIIRLVTQTGQVLAERRADNNTTVLSLNVKEYPRGIYTVSATSTDGHTQTHQLMIVR